MPVIISLVRVQTHYLPMLRETVAVTFLPLGKVQSPTGGGSSAMLTTFPAFEPKNHTTSINKPNNTKHHKH